MRAPGSPLLPEIPLVAGRPLRPGEIVRPGAVLLAQCRVEGLPVPQGSAKWVPRRGTPGKAIPQRNPRLDAWRADIADAARKSSTVYFAHRPLEIRLVFVLARKKTVKKSETVYDLAAIRPDSSKLLRAAEDALTGVWYDDDARLVRHVIEKRAAHPGERPGVEVELWSV